MGNGPRHTLQIGSDCLGVKGESFIELGKNRGGSGGDLEMLQQPVTTKKWALFEMEFLGLEGFSRVCAGAEQPQNPSAYELVGGLAKRGGERSCSPLACCWHVVNLPGLRRKESGLCVLKTQGPFVRRDGHWSKGLNKNTCWVTDQPPGFSIIQLSGSNEVFQYSQILYHNSPHHCS